MLSVLALDLVQWTIEHRPPLVDEQDAVAHLLNLVHVMGAEDDGFTPALFLQQDRFQQGTGFGSGHGDRLVEGDRDTA